MNLIEKIERVIEEDNLRDKCRKQRVVFKKTVLTKLLHSAGITVVSIGEMFNQDHSTIVHRLKKYKVFENHVDFQQVETDLLNRLELISDDQIKKVRDAIKQNKIDILEIEKRTEELKKYVKINEKIVKREVYEASLTKQVLECNDYWQMKQLQEELKKDLH